MIIIGPLWLVATIWLVVWLTKKATSPKRWYCKGCRQPVPRFTPVCPNCRATLTWKEGPKRKWGQTLATALLIFLGMVFAMMLFAIFIAKA